MQLNKPKKDKFLNLILYTIYYSTIFGLGIALFMDNNDVLSAGITGIVQIINFYLPNISFSILYIIINIPGIVLGYFYIGRKFTFLSCTSIATVSIVTAIVPIIMANQITNDILLNCIFGGLFMGYGLGKLLRMGSSTGGTDFYGLALHRYNGSSFAKISTFINVSICVYAGFLFGMETALYTILAIAVRQLVMANIYTNYQKLTTWIICDDIETATDIGNFIHEELNRGYTMVNNCIGGHTKEDKQIVMATIDQFEYKQLRKMTIREDKHVFITTAQTNSIVGNYPLNIAEI